MAMTSIELFALIISALIVVKILFLFFNKESWFKFVKTLYTKNNSISWLLGISSLIVLYFLLKTMTIVQVFAANLFFALLMGMVLVTYGTEFVKMADKIMKRKLPAAVLVNIIIWLVLAIWALVILFT
ncbi:hypothetical protein COY00_00765 [Candidatus Pacearchaeota archaeon CG_4_10_14_0_2_um_filter_35_33]|nr:hypothetical protein [Candidatus Pacearchaeota archaeon]OIO42548.1 MAG: hypothetical protein AUJ63_02590 [Candidatus Pacearchaeota archaeon CG1_02_35_32]PIY81394.1 MAG: hypothetical protein COY79_02680 [Candidatus Pacearchaeota archaeon CG_4_10_14_0_8_um_filter_35_169]PIZ80642.1 MAG: hypothetical protein COY00_00765 [Candidatus Pacearchaeota archaeon CG_4_10_14_0_2_um_filter_35_33]PJA70139.1 MAG: hypothetical protein CO155_01730 [Candidatus Pacearchaeota archaeon CG_4_9_14_3_um_filter_35_19]